MTFQSENDIVVKILELCKEGSTKIKLKNDLAISHVQLRKTLAELVDKRFLEYIEPKQLYITTDKGIKFLNMKRTRNYELEILLVLKTKLLRNCIQLALQKSQFLIDDIINYDN